ncbi:MAG: hypothetical protein ACLQRH_18135 [Acidimicrobiales bacterium]
MTDSFDLKLNRAEHHLKELKREIRRFTGKHAYEAVPAGGTNRKRRSLKWKLHFTEQPDEMVPVIVGDIIHNVRSALDHLIVAHVARKYRWTVSFPIFTECPYREDGTPLDNELGEAWSRAVRGLREPLLTQVKILQPFQPPDEETIAYCTANDVDPMETHSLHELSRLDNADKHRGLIAVAHGLDKAVVTAWEQGTEIIPPNVHQIPFFVKDGTQILSLDIKTVPANRKMNVKVEGTPRVGLQIRSGQGVFRLPETLEKMVGHARDIVGGFRELTGK